MSKSRHTNIVAAYLVLQNNNQVLLLKRQNTGYEDGNFGLISGHVEQGESFTTTLIREAKEEANITINAEDILHTHVQHRYSDWDQTERVDVYFLVEKWSGKLCNTEPSKCSSLDWFSYNILPENIIPCVKEALLQIQGRTPYSEFGWNEETRA